MVPIFVRKSQFSQLLLFEIYESNPTFNLQQPNIFVEYVMCPRRTISIPLNSLTEKKILQYD